MDTHAFLWLAGNWRLSVAARDVIYNPGNSVLVSAASAWEIATRHRLGKLPVCPSKIMAHDLPVVSNESPFDRHGVRRIW